MGSYWLSDTEVITLERALIISFSTNISGGMHSEGAHCHCRLETNAERGEVG